jgi:hypothetical protein
MVGWLLNNELVRIWKKSWPNRSSVLVFSWRDWRTPRKTSTRIVDIRAETETEYLPKQVYNGAATPNCFININYFVIKYPTETLEKYQGNILFRNHGNVSTEIAVDFLTLFRIREVLDSNLGHNTLRILSHFHHGIPELLQTDTVKVSPIGQRSFLQRST